MYLIRSVSMGQAVSNSRGQMLVWLFKVPWNIIYQGFLSRLTWSNFPLVSNPNQFCPCTYYIAIIHLSITYELDRIGGILWWHLRKNMGLSLFKNMKGFMLAILNSPLLLKLVFYWGCTVCPVVVFKTTMVPSTSGETKPRTTAEAWIPGDQTWDANGLVHDVEPERSCGMGMLGKVWGWGNLQVKKS